MRHVRSAVKELADAVPAEILHHAESVRVRTRLNHPPEIAESRPGATPRDGELEASAPAASAGRKDQRDLN